MINSTFTAGGLSAPLFVNVYGLTSEEMPSSEIITIPVPGLAVGSHQDVYSTGVGYLTFVKGSGNYVVETDEGAAANTTYSRTVSKESRIAELYRKKIYYQFVDHIRKTKYDFDGNRDDIPDHLQCIS